MSHPIWKIGLFTKLSKDKAECTCKKSGLTKHTFVLTDGSTKSLITHMNSKLHVDEYSGRYRQLVEQQNQAFFPKRVNNIFNSSENTEEFFR
jgi:hypothetical protein